MAGAASNVERGTDLRDVAITGQSVDDLAVDLRSVGLVPPSQFLTVEVSQVSLPPNGLGAQLRATAPLWPAQSV